MKEENNQFKSNEVKTQHNSNSNSNSDSDSDSDSKKDTIENKQQRSDHRVSKTISREETDSLEFKQHCLSAKTSPSVDGTSHSEKEAFSLNKLGSSSCGVIIEERDHEDSNPPDSARRRLSSGSQVLGKIERGERLSSSQSFIILPKKVSQSVPASPSAREKNNKSPNSSRRYSLVSPSLLSNPFFKEEDTVKGENKTIDRSSSSILSSNPFILQERSAHLPPICSFDGQEKDLLLPQSDCDCTLFPSLSGGSLSLSQNTNEAPRPRNKARRLSSHGIPLSVVNQFAEDKRDRNDVIVKSSEMFSSPVEKTIMILKKLRAKAFANDLEDINFALDTITSGNLHTPIFNSHSPSEVNQWLFGEYASQEHDYLAKDPNLSPIRFKLSKKFTLSELSGNREVGNLLGSIDQWDFDVFSLNTLTNGHPLTTVATHIFKKLNFFEKFSIPPHKFKYFITEIEDGYHPQNPYHNAIHAADVAQAMYFFIISGLISKGLTDVEILVLLISAIIHDYDHPGTNNAFHIRSHSPLALVYNDISVLENFHLSQAFKLLRKPEANIFESFTNDEFLQIRSLIVSVVLATDMSHHFENLTKLRTRIDRFKESSLTDREDRKMLMQIAMKMSDLSSQARSSSLSIQWSTRIMQEFFLQGDCERDSCLPISPFMDRNNSSIPKCQIGFIEFIVKPLMECWSEIFPGCKLCVGCVDENIKHWKKELEKETNWPSEVQSE